jgi:hypothetical protein
VDDTQGIEVGETGRSPHHEFAFCLRLVFVYNYTDTLYEAMILCSSVRSRDLLVLTRLGRGASVARSQHWSL